jgi:hypothetical protein
MKTTKFLTQDGLSTGGASVRGPAVTSSAIAYFHVVVDALSLIAPRDAVSPVQLTKHL